MQKHFQKNKTHTRLSAASIETCRRIPRHLSLFFDFAFAVDFDLAFAVDFDLAFSFLFFFFFYFHLIFCFYFIFYLVCLVYSGIAWYTTVCRGIFRHHSAWLCFHRFSIFLRFFSQVF